MDAPGPPEREHDWVQQAVTEARVEVLSDGREIRKDAAPADRHNGTRSKPLRARGWP